MVQEYLIFWANDTTATIQEGIVVSCCRNGLVYTLYKCVGPWGTVYVQLARNLNHISELSHDHVHEEERSLFTNLKLENFLTEEALLPQ